MKKNVFGRQFKRDANERTALFKNLLTQLVLNERIKTTEAKAKAIKAAADKLVTKAKKGGQKAYRLLEAEVHHDAVVKLIDVIAPRFAKRSGGYTRITKIGHRIADNAQMALMEWTEIAKVEEKNEKQPEGKKVEKKAASNAVKKADAKKATSNVAKEKIKKAEKKEAKAKK